MLEGGGGSPCAVCHPLPLRGEGRCSRADPAIEGAVAGASASAGLTEGQVWPRASTSLGIVPRLRSGMRGCQRYLGQRSGMRGARGISDSARECGDASGYLGQCSGMRFGIAWLAPPPLRSRLAGRAGCGAESCPRQAAEAPLAPFSLQGRHFRSVPRRGCAKRRAA